MTYLPDTEGTNEDVTWDTVVEHLRDDEDGRREHAGRSV